ncbi:hypothetical protein DVR12_00170 [Chitinophaga silvatica]|uniref:Prolyl-tRNA synthetase n=1 Tax=Chitinophaga silvatica TaxID=2282649 RepID=A0A3E1YFS2_9BACT|nr:hypothetical protein [Chitinophaga silvatica]RFS26241.1 hypothetical protein DVR12_00170 [Chitinophaga silvatica]
MKPILYVGLAASLALGGCASTYKTAQTPDDVYYSPRQQQRNTYASSNGSNGNSRQDENANYVEAVDDGGTYVTYQDEDQGDYQRRLNRFGNANTYSGGYMDGYNAASNMYMNSFYGGGLGMAYSPYSSFYPYSSFGMSFGWGSSFYRPWSFGYGGGFGYPYIGSYWPGYYSYYPTYYYPYYGGGYYGGGYYHGGGGYANYRSPSYGPVRSGNERIITRSPNNNNGGVTGGNGYVRPARGGFQPTNGGYNNGNTTPNASERPRRIFQQSSNERPVVTRPSVDNSNNNNNNTYSRPQRVEYSRPAPAPAPAPVSRPSYSPSPSSGGSSGGGGGYSRPVRGGR